MENSEVIVNLWYVIEEGIIYSLRAKAYTGSGSDEQKLKFLQQRASLDYLIADTFEIPHRFHIQVGISRDSRVMPVAHISMLWF